MRNTRLRRVLCLLLAVQMLLPTSAGAQNTTEEVSKWMVSWVTFSHKAVTFTLSEVDGGAQNVVAQIEKKGSRKNQKLLDIPFSVTGETEKITVPIPGDRYLEAGNEYVLTLMNEEGEAVSEKKSALLKPCELLHEGTAYPVQAEIAKTKPILAKVTAKIGENVYEGTIATGAAVTITYPKQQTGTTVHMTFQDACGCQSETDWTVENRAMTLPDLLVWRDCVVMNQESFAADERIGVRIGEQVYYSDYQMDAGEGRLAIVTYPLQQPGTSVYIWKESTNGSSTKEKEFLVQACGGFQLSGQVCDPTKLSGVSAPNLHGQQAVRVAVWIGETEYAAQVQADGSFSVSYPEQAGGTVLTVVYSDAHGCQEQKELMVVNELAAITNDIPDADVLANHIVSAYSNQDHAVKMLVSIGDVVYESDYVKGDKPVVYYPVQKAGTELLVWYTMENGSRSPHKKYKITDKKCIINADSITADGIKGQLQLSVQYTGSGTPQINPTAVYAEIDGVRYDGTVSEDGKFSVSYAAHVDNEVHLVIEDADGYVYTTDEVVPNRDPRITMNRVDANSTKIVGYTAAKASVRIKIHGKIYRTTSNKKGKYTVKIKRQKAGRKIWIYVKTKEGYTSDDVYWVQKSKGYILLCKNVYRNSTTVKCRIVGAGKGEKVRLTIGSRSYTKKITKNKKNQTLHFGIRKAAAGSALYLNYYASNGKKKDSEVSMVYYGDVITAGMSEKNARLTTWGKPDRENQWGIDPLQLVFESPAATLYAYVQDGKVTKVQKVMY